MSKKCGCSTSKDPVDGLCDKHWKQLNKKPCDHRVKSTPSGYVCVKCGRFA